MLSDRSDVMPNLRVSPSGKVNVQSEPTAASRSPTKVSVAAVVLPSVHVAVQLTPAEAIGVAAAAWASSRTRSICGAGARVQLHDAKSSVVGGFLQEFL
eukprot:4797837-Prymnesium_polylepis.1